MRIMERIMLGPALAVALAVSASAGAQMPEPVAPVDELAIGEADLRMTVPVTIEGTGRPPGPWPFVIDTGAERTVLSAELARRLALAPGQGVRVTTMAGTAPAPTARVPALRVSTLRPPAIEAPLFARANLGAIGMLGLDALQSHAVSIDFAQNRMTLRPSKRRRPSRALPDEIVVTAKSLYGQLIVTDAHWRGRRIAVVLDTGTPVTIANPALLRELKSPPPSFGEVPVIAVTGETLIARGHLLRDVEIGKVRFASMAVAVADAAPFRRFGLEDTPALMLGMDALRLFRTVDIDFPARSIRFRLPRAALVRTAF